MGAWSIGKSILSAAKQVADLATLVGWDDASLRQSGGFVNSILHNAPTHDTVALCDWQKDYGTNCDYITGLRRHYYGSAKQPLRQRRVFLESFCLPVLPACGTTPRIGPSRAWAWAGQSQWHDDRGA